MLTIGPVMGNLSFLNDLGHVHIKDEIVLLRRSSSLSCNVSSYDTECGSRGEHGCA